MVDLTSTCRTCMKSNVNMVDIFGPVKIEESCPLKLSDLLTETTSLEVAIEDGLPQTLCDTCVNTLQIVYAFRLQAVQVESELKKLLYNTPIKNEKHEVDIKAEGSDYLEEFDDYLDTMVPKEELGLEEIYECKICNKQYNTHKKYTKHLSTHETNVACLKCKKKFRKQSSLEKHSLKCVSDQYDITKTNVDNKCTATNCDLSFSLVNKNIDERFEKENNVYKCPECDAAYDKPRALLTHMKKHDRNSGEKFKCDHCNKLFSLKTLLRRHMRLHMGHKPFKCTECTKSFSRKDQLSYHKNQHKNERPYVCPHCQKSFTQQCSLKAHTRIHTGETPFLCWECGKSFNNKSNLRQHLMRHAGVKPFPCKLCPKSFCTKGQMKSHMDTHTDAHPYKCNECNSSFTKQTSLKKHSLIHLGIKQFACETCNRRFTIKDHLKRHERVHTGEKPYKCTYCERAFTQSGDLVKHTRIHVGQNLYQCDICHIRFRLLRDLKHHYPSHYNESKRNDVTPNMPSDVTCTDVTCSDVTKEDGRITITFSNLLDKSNGDITINISPEKI